MKPQDHFGYVPQQAEACERLLVTLLRSIGPWKETITLIGGLVPSLLFSGEGHVGTTDVDLVLDLKALASAEAYRTLEQNLKRLGLERGRNVDGEAQHFRWTNEEKNATVEFLCPVGSDQGGKVVPLKSSGQKKLSALGIPGAHLVLDDFVEKTITAELLGDRGKASVTVRMAGVASYVVLKSLAYEDRMEPKDAYDLIFVLFHHPLGPEGVGKLFAQKMKDCPQEPLWARALEILKGRFLSDDSIEGADKDGPVSYARFTQPNSPQEQAIARQDAVAVVAAFLDSAESQR